MEHNRPEGGRGGRKFSGNLRRIKRHKSISVPGAPTGNIL